MKEGGSLATNGGWIRLEDVYFLVNSLNKSSFIMEKEDEDPNNDLTFYLDEKGGYDGSKTSKDFVYAAPGLQYEVIGFSNGRPSTRKTGSRTKTGAAAIVRRRRSTVPRTFSGRSPTKGRKRCLRNTNTCGR